MVNGQRQRERRLERHHANKIGIGEWVAGLDTVRTGECRIVGNNNGHRSVAYLVIAAFGVTVGITVNVVRRRRTPRRRLVNWQQARHASEFTG